MNTVNYTFDTAGMVSILIGVVLPLLTALATRSSMSRDVKGVVLLALASVTAVVTQFAQAQADNSRFDWKGVVLTAVVTFVVALATHYGIWKSGSLQPKLAKKGLK